jgi:YgiT-type zinc finger domain-containing protein
MKCVICKHEEIQPGTTTMTLERDTTTVVFKNVPAEVCQTCGEAYLDASTTRDLLHICRSSSRFS